MRLWITGELFFSFFSFFFFNDTATTEIYTLSLHDALPIFTTVHQAKGLEWNTVFIIGLNDGRFPSVISLKEGAEEEERRLFYVAATRAKERLFLCYTLTGGYSDGAGFLKPSRFIRELDRQHYDRMSIERDY